MLIPILPKVEICTRQKLCRFGRSVVKAKLFCLKKSSYGSHIESSYGEKIFIPVTEVSITGPTRLLTWTNQTFYEEKGGEARSWKPSQPGWPGSYEQSQENHNSNGNGNVDVAKQKALLWSIQWLCKCVIILGTFLCRALQNNNLKQLFRQRLSHRSVKAYSTMPIGSIAVERVRRWLIEVHGVYQQEKIRHKFICLCRFPLCRWNT